MLEGLLKKNRTGFLYSDLYLIFLMVVGFFTWYFEVENVGFVVLTIVVSMILCLHDDFAPVIPAALTACFIIPNKPSTEYVYENIVLYALIATCVISSIVVFFIRNRNFKIGTQFVGCACLAGAYLFGGIFYSFDMWVQGLPTTALFAGALFGVYFIASSGIKEGNNVYIAKVFTYISILILAESCAFFLSSGDSFVHIISHKSLHLGWGLSNNIGAVLLLAIPMNLYLAVKDKKSVPVCAVIFIVQVVVLILTLSRGSVLAAAVGVPAALAYACVKTKHKKIFFTCFGAVLGTVVVLCLLHTDYVSIIWERLRILDFSGGSLGFDDSGRFKIYETAIRDFLLAPVNGVGVAIRIEPDLFNFRWYHCTPLQILVNAGAIGVLSYVIHLFFKYKIFFIKKARSMNWFIFIGIAMWSFYGLLDCNYFLYYQIIMMVVLLVYAEKNLPEGYDAYAFLRRKKKAKK